MDDLVLIGIARKIRGAKGELKVESFSDVAGRFLGLKNAYVRKRGEVEPIEHVVERCEEISDYVVLKLKDVSNFEEASEFIGCEIFVNEVDRAEVPAGTYFVDSLVGMSVIRPGGRGVGIVADVTSNGAQSLLSIQMANGSKFSLPFVKSFVKSVDVRKRLMEVELIDGMIEGGLDED